MYVMVNDDNTDNQTTRLASSLISYVYILKVTMLNCW